MTALRNRLTRLEAQRPPESVKPALTFMWFGEKDDAELAEIKVRAEAENRPLMVIRIVEPSPRERPHAQH
jgi:hypothetical protein